jgi:hypothetical protein
MRWIRQSYLSRGIAIFFFVFTVADLANPHLCAEEMGLSSLPVSAASEIENTVAVFAARAGSHSHQEESPAPQQADEDCFCCCSHILPSLQFVVEGLLLEPVDTDSTISSLPTGPPHKLYRPPRLS